MSPTPAILVSGWAHPADVLCPLAAALRPDFDSICLSTKELGDNQATWSSALAERIRSAGSPPLVVGWSMGGMVAIEALTSDSPPPAAALALIGSTVRFCAAPDWPWGQTPSALRALRTGLRRDARAALAGFLRECAAPDAPAEDALHAGVDAALSMGLPHLLDGLDYLGSTDLTGRIGRLKTRCICIHGNEDRIIPSDASWAIAKHTSGFLEVHAERGHSLPVASPVLVADAIRRGWGQR
ncbi:MAG: alpha/beta fold hydrolase [Lentisphaerae bacterium]|nr:alpha/beta fold hydrolase [Lentisphaerota bacterium]